MNLINLDQGSTTWLEWRAEGITATEMVIILGLNPYEGRTPYRLYLEKTGQANPPEVNTFHTDRGHRLEPRARAFCEDRDSVVLETPCIEYSAWPTLRASLDGLTLEGDIVYEFKAPSPSVFAEIRKNGTASPTYAQHRAQVLTQCICADTTEGKLVYYTESYSEEGGLEVDTIEFNITLTEDDKAHILEAAMQFQACLDSGTAPDIDPERDLFIPASGEQEFMVQALASEWTERNAKIQTLKAELKALDTDQKQTVAGLTAQMGDFKKMKYAGISVTTFTKSGNVDWPALAKAEGIDEAVIESHRKADRKETRVSIPKTQEINEDVVGNESKGATGWF